jgi:hypothetical protein
MARARCQKTDHFIAAPDDPTINYNAAYQQFFIERYNEPTL